jgi:hypothetical protein
MIVIVAEEDALAPIAALREMVGKAGNNEAGEAGHVGRLSGIVEKSKLST